MGGGGGAVVAGGDVLATGGAVVVVVVIVERVVLVGATVVLVVAFVVDERARGRAFEGPPHAAADTARTINTPTTPRARTARILRTSARSSVRTRAGRGDARRDRRVRVVSAGADGASRLVFDRVDNVFPSGHDDRTSELHVDDELPVDDESDAGQRRSGVHGNRRAGDGR